MLVVSRKRTETIHIGQDIVVKITSLGRNVVRIGIDAPKDMVIMRGELLEKDKEAARSVAAV